jgi:site-specific DNA recombinase
MYIGKARGYVRVSTHYQAEDGQSIETQEKKIKAHCEYKGLELLRVYTDAGISAKDTRRPSLQNLIKEAEEGDYVIVSDLSRLSRNTRDALNLFEEFKERNIKFVCLQPDIDLSTPVGNLLMTVMMAVHHLERQNIGAHVSSNMQRISREGKLRTRPPFGYKFVSKDQDYDPVPEQLEVKDKILQMHRDGMKFSQIAKQLNLDGDNKVLNLNKRAQTEKVSIFYAQTIKRILIDYGAIPGEGACSNRAPIDRRIISYRKHEENSPEKSV